MFRGSPIPGVYIVLLAEFRDLLISYGYRYVALVRQKYNRYTRTVRQRDLLPEIV